MAGLPAVIVRKAAPAFAQLPASSALNTAPAFAMLAVATALMLAVVKLNPVLKLVAGSESETSKVGKPPPDPVAEYESEPVKVLVVVLPAAVV